MTKIEELEMLQSLAEEACEIIGRTLRLSRMSLYPQDVVDAKLPAAAVRLVDAAGLAMDALSYQDHRPGTAANATVRGYFVDPGK